MAFAPRVFRVALTMGATALASTFTLPAQAQIAACSGAYDLATVFGGGFECLAGDKIYNNFVDINSNLPGNFTLSIVDADPFHTLSTLGTYTGAPLTGTTYAFSYTVAVDPAVTNRHIQSFITDFTLFPDVPNNVKELTATNPSAGPAVATRVGGVAPSPSVVLPGSPLSVDFTSSLTVAPESFVTGTSDTVFQGTRSSQVPAPLPIFGAGAAFALSRKMRRRILAAA